MNTKTEKAHVRVHGEDRFIGTVNFKSNPDDIMVDISKLAKGGIITNPPQTKRNAPDTLSDCVHCAHSDCSNIPTHHASFDVGGIPIHIGLCEEHALQWDAKHNPLAPSDQSTIVVYETNECWEPDDSLTLEQISRARELLKIFDQRDNANVFATQYSPDSFSTIEFLCPCCGKVHYHGTGTGGRSAHCDDINAYYIVVAPDDVELLKTCLGGSVEVDTYYIEKRPRVYEDHALVALIDKHVRGIN